eukprot:758405-Hanusia_phi.AAC.3
MWGGGGGSLGLPVLVADIPPCRNGTRTQTLGNALHSQIKSEIHVVGATHCPSRKGELRALAWRVHPMLASDMGGGPMLGGRSWGWGGNT